MAASVLPLAILCLTITAATASPISGNTVTGDLTVVGSKIIIDDGTDHFEIRNINHRVDFWQSDPGQWVWSYGAPPTDVMSLDSANVLSLYDLGASVNPAIELDPGNSDPMAYVAPSIMIGNSEVLTVANSPTLLSSGFVTRTSNNLGSQESFLMEGTFGGSGDIPASGEGTRMMWYPEKAAFRAGHISAGWQSDSWDDLYTGNYSVAMGLDVIAMGDAATAFGIGSYASGQASTAFGYNTGALGIASTAFGDYTQAGGYASTAFGIGSYAYDGHASTAFGIYTNAYGEASTAFGNYTYADGYASTAFGFNSFALGYASTVVGHYNEARFDSSNPMAANSWIGDDKNSVFEVGVGQDYSTPANALTILQDGSVEVGMDTGLGIPLHIKANGKVVIAVPQGDISMGIYGN